eukprot:667778-Alexandrium_andersonii.AAC.1
MPRGSACSSPKPFFPSPSLPIAQGGSARTWMLCAAQDARISALLARTCSPSYTRSVALQDQKIAQRHILADW